MMTMTTSKSNTIKYRILNQERVKVPKIFIGANALETIAKIPHLFDSEVSWFLEVEQHSDIDYEILPMVHVAEHTVSAVTIDIPAESYGDMMLDILDNEGDSAYQQVRCWAHSHVDMAVGPSGTDLAQMESFCSDAPNIKFYIMLIANKRGDIRLDFYDLVENLVFEGLQYTTEVPTLNKLLLERFKGKVTVKQAYRGSSYSGWTQNGYVEDFRGRKAAEVAEADRFRQVGQTDEVDKVDKIDEINDADMDAIYEEYRKTYGDLEEDYITYKSFEDMEAAITVGASVDTLAYGECLITGMSLAKGQVVYTAYVLGEGLDVELAFDEVLGILEEVDHGTK